ncbi:Uma2 family endonuclease [Pseudenhygromyxa sp. WMMC2535]|uniref:Uma2 family endonuclease n=1 Tax=Pseudenhygromyxa sp. WMMC2535 TaxID=2712867 RepID=UPI0015516D69|nr:Uma2 family endonuclease [Pseudenhygromyxa sp. WMMC2535]NVB36231.1 Uma2 family endonuclease [Pseudenhygromyxa sp. WMMC2535]NVB43726.1 Uma2 family endonuclease [Pseudenhygromyxa sp. WMMC2535]NVB43736.1 Uma2 family endonuclease [Pseudenhygromyxa sp. WMMC2535]
MSRALPKPIKRGATFRDFNQHDRKDRVTELIGGDLYSRPAPHFFDLVVRSTLLSELERLEGWLLLEEPLLRLDGEELLVPGIAGWRYEGEATKFEAQHICAQKRPDWVCELLTPAFEELDRQRKLPRYAEAGVAFVWLIDRPRRRLEIYQTRDGVPTLLQTHSGNAYVRADPFVSCTLSLGPLW